MPPTQPLVFVIVAAALAMLFLVLNTNGQADSVSNNLPNPNYPPPPSLGSFGDQAIEFLSTGISRAEGFGKAGAIPTLAHNPGDLVIPNWQGQKMGGEGISVFASDLEGWNRLKYQLYLIGSGQSHVYSLNMTIADMAAKWTRTDPGVWATNVARSIGTTTDVTLGDLFAGTAS
jgi:hypothetical protein